MTIEEKSYEAYTELINRLEDVKNAIKKQNYGIAMDILYKPYPEFQITTSTELKESEDERVRKALIKLVKKAGEGYENVIDGVSIENAISWLEKQKEFVSADFDDVWETADCNELTAPLEKYSKDAIKEMCHAWYDKGIELERRNWLEKQGEQKESPCDKCRKAQPSHSCSDITALGRCALEKQGEQNPAWSEEDEKMLNDAIGAVGIADYYTYDDKQEIENWLKSLKDRVQPKQEWSEEDKKLINDTCHLINTLASGYGEKVTEPISFTGVQQINSIKTRLRALVDSRPQNTWKPSDLQIKALEYYTKGGCVDKEGIFGSELVKLLEELKKL